MACVSLASMPPTRATSRNVDAHTHGAGSAACIKHESLPILTAMESNIVIQAHDLAMICRVDAAVVGASREQFLGGRTNDHRTKWIAARPTDLNRCAHRTLVERCRNLCEIKRSRMRRPQTHHSGCRRSGGQRNY